MTLLALLGFLGGLAAAVPLLVRRWGRDAGYPLAVGYLAASGLLASQLPAVLAGGVVEFSWRWLPSVGVTGGLRLDGLAMIFALLVLGVGTLIMAYCPRYLRGDEGHTKLYLLLTLFTVSMLGLILAADLLLVFSFWELTSLLSFALIGHAGPAAHRPAIRAFLITFGGGLALLAAVVLIVVTYGTADVARILDDPQRLTSSPVAGVVGALIIVAAFTKSAQVPFHFWLPNAMVAITPVSAYLHAATMVKAGIYLLMRFTPIFAEQPGWMLTLVGGGLLTALLGAFLALRQDDLKALLAYSTVSQLGLLVAVIGIGTPIAMEAALLHTIAHALFKATLFMLVGIIDREAGSRDIRQLSGLARVMPITAVLTGLAAMSMAGLPPLIGFVSKEAIFEAFGDAGNSWFRPVAVTLAVTASTLTFAYGTRIMYAFTGPLRQHNLYEPSLLFLAPAAVAATLGVVLGPGVVLLSNLIERATLDARPGGRPVDLLLWHGFTPALRLSMITIALGTVLFLTRRTVNPLMRSVPTPPPFERIFSRVYAVLLHLGDVVGRPDRRREPAAHLRRPVLALVILVAAGAVPAYRIGDLPSWGGAGSQATDWPLLALLALAVGGLLVVRSALAAVALVGLVGLVMAIWFISVGAPDVALTLLLVEVLNAVVAMLVLRRLPTRLPTALRRRGGTLATAGLAVAAGLTMGYATAVLTGRAPLSGPGSYFLTQAEAETGGSNVVNTILVEFRALDTLGEAAVLAAVALGLIALLRSGQPDHTGGGWDAPADLVLGFAYRLLAPVLLLVSAYLLVRGHDEPGGGFIAALVAGIALGLGQLAFPGAQPPWLRRLRAGPLLAAGFLLATGAGLGPMLAGNPFLTPVPIPLGPTGWYLSCSLLFDLGVYLVVLGLVLTAVNRLDVPTADVPTADVPTADVPTADVPTADVGRPGEQR